MLRNPSNLSRSSATYCGAMQIPGIRTSLTRVVSSAGSAAITLVVRAETAVPTRVLSHARRLIIPSSPFQLVQEPPVGTLRDEALRRRLDHSRLAEAERIEASGVLRIGDAPLVVRNILHDLERVIVAWREAAVELAAALVLLEEGGGRVEEGHAALVEHGPFDDLVRPQQQ